jgi:hypothetical protein
MGFGNGRSDPFETSAILLTPFEQSLLAHCEYDILQFILTIFHTDALLDIDYIIPSSTMHYPPISFDNSYPTDMRSQWVALSMTDPGALNGLLLTACRSLASLTNDETFMIRALRYKVECIRSSKSDIEISKGTTTDVMVVKALYLASDEVD